MKVFNSAKRRIHSASYNIFPQAKHKRPAVQHLGEDVTQWQTAGRRDGGMCVMEGEEEEKFPDT